ncbi:MAG TPA: hypothetical protein VKV57_00040 [bacterium]|nr:hypothetical protein [bacterium]
MQTLERHPGQPLLDEVRVLSRWLREDGSGVLFISSHGGRMNRSTVENTASSSAVQSDVAGFLVEAAGIEFSAPVRMSSIVYS